MAEIIGVRFKSAGKVYYFDPADLQFSRGDRVIVETARGIECGEVAMDNRKISDEEVVKPLKQVIRAATESDLKRVRDNAAREKQAFEICNEKIAKHKLKMKLVDVEFTFDNNKILFYFTADGRVDFRELVKTSLRSFAPALSCGRSGCATKQRCSAGLASVGGSSAVPRFWGSSSRFRSRWQKSRGCL